MPTLIEVPIDASMESIDEDRSSRRHQEAAPNERTFANDESTRLFDETVLGNGSMDMSQRGPFDEANKHHGSFVDNDETRLDVDATTLNNDDTILNIARQMEANKPSNYSISKFDYEKPEPVKRIAGPEERHYTQHFERYVTHVIEDFENQHPDKVRDYRSMSPSEKEREQSRVNALLSRLGGSTTTVLHCRAHVDGAQFAPAEMAETSEASSATYLSEKQPDTFTQHSHPQGTSLTPPNDGSSLSQSSRDHQGGDEDMLTGECHQSSALLSSESPQAEVDELAARLDQSMALMSPSSDVDMSPPARYSQPPSQQQPSQQRMHHKQQLDRDDDSSSSASSVEIVRRTASARSTPSSQMYESPTITTNRMKRMASASGKRGTDQSRMKLDEESFASFDASIVRPSEMIASPSQLLCSSTTSPESPLFQASQSPIDDAFSSAEKVNPRSDTQRQPPRLDVYEDDPPPTNPDDTLQSLDVTNNPRRNVRWNEESFLQEIPANVRLKENAPFRLKPLRVGRPSRQEVEEEGRRRKMAIGKLPDPLGNYEGALRKRIKAVYGWMKEKDTLSNDPNENGAILFSLSPGQIIDVTMKLCIKHKSNHNLKDTIDGEVLNGGTLIVARTKEDLEDWQSSLRECTAFSVLNHALMSVEDRKRSSSANRCAGYDVVVTTFDALKSKDIATPLDARGHVIHEKIGYQDGWYSARSSSSQTGGHNESLSVLHQINWRRVVFVDTLGRKSFVVKQSTARATAAVAVASSSRFLFFPAVPGDKMSAVDALAKSDKKSFKSVAAVLHLDEDAAVGGRLSDSMLDMNDVKDKPTNRSRR